MPLAEDKRSPAALLRGVFAVFPGHHEAIFPNVHVHRCHTPIGHQTHREASVGDVEEESTVARSVVAVRGKSRAVGVQGEAVQPEYGRR